MQDAGIFLNGRWRAREEAFIPADDRGFAFSEGLYETLRVRGGRPCLAQEHLGRLRASCAFLGMTYPDVDLAAVAAEGAARAGLADASARIVLTAGSGGDLAGPGDRPGTLLVQIRPSLGPGHGLSLRISSHRQSATSVLVRHKTLRFHQRILALREAKALGADNAVLLNDLGEVAESTTANVFWVKDGTVATPALACNILAGVTRAVALRAARELGLPVAEVRAPGSALEDADEIFITSGSRGIAPVVSLEGRPVSKGRTGPVTARLMPVVETLETP